MLISFFHYFWRLYSFQNVNMINSAWDTSTLITWLLNHTLHLSSNVHYLRGNNFVAPKFSQILLHTILFHISNIHFWCHIISNYSLGNTPFSIDFDQTVTTDPTSRRLDCINLLTHQLSNACSLIDQISFYSVGHNFTLFTSLKVKNVLMIHGFKFRYILMENKFPSCIKEPQNE